MRYFALTTGAFSDVPVAIVRFDPQKMMVSILNGKTKQWVDNNELMDIVTGRSSDGDYFEISESEAEKIRERLAGDGP